MISPWAKVLFRQVLGNAPVGQQWSLGQHLSLTAQGSPSVTFIMQDQEIASCDTTEHSQFDERPK